MSLSTIFTPGIFDLNKDISRNGIFGDGVFPSSDILQFTVAVGAGKTFNLPFEAVGTYNIFVEWGDGTTDIILEWDAAETEHVYPADATYTIRIHKLLVGFNFYTGLNNSNKDKVRVIENWGGARLGNATSYFYQCDYLTVTATDNLDLFGTIDSSWMFSECLALTSVPSINNCDWSKATTVRNLLSFTPLFDQELHLNTRSVISVKQLLSGCTTFNSTVNIDWATIEDAESFLDSCPAYNQPITINAPNLTTLKWAFHGTTNMNSTVNLNVPLCVRFSNMFELSGYSQPTNWTVGTVNKRFEGLFLNGSFNNTFEINDVSNLQAGALAGFRDAFIGTPLSTVNYNFFLNMIVSFNPQIAINVRLDADAKYTAGAVPNGGNSRATLAFFGWTINDGGAV